MSRPVAGEPASGGVRFCSRRRRRRRRLLVAALVLTAALAAASAPGCAWLLGGYPDGAQQPSLFGDHECSRSPDVAPACCADHDLAYAAGGTEQDRLTADLELAACLALYGVRKPVVHVYLRSVRRFGGSSWRYLPERTRGPPENRPRLGEP